MRYPVTSLSSGAIHTNTIPLDADSPVRPVGAPGLDGFVPFDIALTMLFHVNNSKTTAATVTMEVVKTTNWRTLVNIMVYLTSVSSLNATASNAAHTAVSMIRRSSSLPTCTCRAPAAEL